MSASKPLAHGTRKGQKSAPKKRRKNATERQLLARVNELRSAHDRLGQTLLGLLDAIGAGIELRARALNEIRKTEALIHGVSQ